MIEVQKTGRWKMPIKTAANDVNGPLSRGLGLHTDTDTGMMPIC